MINYLKRWFICSWRGHNDVQMMIGPAYIITCWRCMAKIEVHEPTDEEWAAAKDCCDD